jgi:hypothetical protein
MIIAGTDFDPSVGHSDKRFGKIIIAETASAKHGAGAGAVGAVNQRMAAWFGGRLHHYKSPVRLMGY